MSKKILVTGANGHIGSNTVRALLEDGAKVVAMVRAGSDRRGLEGLDVEVREADVLDRDAVRRALVGVDCVIHAAASHRNFAVDADDIVRPAVEGTKNVLDACSEHGVKRMVLTSSGATIGFAASADAPLDETHRVVGARSAYVRAKCAQEALALEERRVDVVVLNPSGVLGPNDYRLTPTTRAFIGMLQGDPAVFALSVTDVRDVARAHVRALSAGTPGERYLITGEVLTPARLCAVFESIVGFGPKAMTPPRFLMNFIAWNEERKARSSGADAGLTRDMVADVWGKHLAYDSSKSRAELGMTYRPAADVVRDSVTWLLERGALKPKVAARIEAHRR